jgi:predicted Zn finger-like uncharacterized protein
MAASAVSCPSCGTRLKIEAPIPAGKGVKCPKCGQVFRVRAPAAAPPAAKAAPAPTAKPAPKAAPAPATRPPSKAAPPAKPKPARPRPGADEDEPEPPRKGRRPAREAPKSSKGKVLLFVVLGLLLLCGGGVGAAIWAVNKFLDKTGEALAQLTAKGGPPIDKPIPPPDDSGKQPPPGGEPTKPAFDARFVAPDFVAAVVVNGRQSLASPLLKSLLPDDLLARLTVLTGIDPRKLERALVFAEPFPGGNVAFFPGFVFRFSEPVDGQAAMKGLLAEMEPATFQGKAYFTSKQDKMAGVPTAAHVADDRTVLLAPETTLKKMLQAGDAPKGPLVEQLNRTDLKADVVATLVVQPVRKEAVQIVKENKLAEGLPPSLAGAEKLPEKVRAVTLALSFDGDPLLKVTLEAEDDAAAAEVEALAGKARDELKLLYPEMRKDLAAALPPDLAQPVASVADQLPDGLAVSRSGREVVLSLKAPRGLAELGPKLEPLARETFGGGGAPPKPGPWLPFVDKDRGFTTAFPGNPKLTTVKDDKAGTVSHTFTAHGLGGLVQYTVLCMEFPNDVSPLSKTLLDGVVGGFPKESVKARRDVRIQGHPGVEFVVAVDDKGVSVEVSNRVYVVKKRMYHVMVVAPATAKEDAQAQKFLDGFALLEDGGTKPPTPPTPPVLERPALEPKPLPGRKVSGEVFKGDAKEVMDVLVTPISLSEKTLPCLTWADDKGSAFYALDSSGELRRVSYPGLKEEWRQELGEKCAWMSLSSEGLLVTPADGKEVWLIDPAKGTMKSRFALTGVKWTASVPGSSLAVASTGADLFALDLKKGVATRYGGTKPQFGGLERPAMTPDGKYVFSTGGLGIQQMHRWSFDGGRLRLEQSSEGIAQGVIHTGATVSPDSKLVCFPSYVGGGGGKIYTLAVFKVGDLKKPAFVLDPGGTAIGFDPAAGYIYTQDLRLYEIGGTFIKEYELFGRPPMIAGMRQILVHPAGATFLLMTSGTFSLVEVPKK